ncbi:MAG: SEC-C domain-containing protein [Catenulisporales bacterium]|nr:SEC-C domain-containing protein [Catenulisporales bacterium]
MPRTDRRGRDRDRNRRRDTAPAACPCGRGELYADCCGALHAGRTTAATAEQLMRSRYSAFAVMDAAYLLKTWHSSTRPAHVDFDPKLRWTGLDIVGTTGGTAFHTDGTVEFIAHYTESGQPGSMRENSSFVREDGNWVYLSAR